MAPMAESLGFWLFTFGILSLVSVCRGGEFCSDLTYCEHGCCDYDDNQCCTSVVGLIIGLCVAAAVTIFVIIIIICICRRRSYRGHVYQSQPGQTVVIQQGVTTNSSGYVSTAGLQPGAVVYPPYQAYPHMATATAPIAPPPYTGQPYAPPVYAMPPPSYDSLGAVPTQGAAGTQGGVDNPVFTGDQKG